MVCIWILEILFFINKFFISAFMLYKNEYRYIGIQHIMSFLNSDIQGHIIKVNTYNVFLYLSFGKLKFALMLNQFYVLYFSLIYTDTFLKPNI